MPSVKTRAEAMKVAETVVEFLTDRKLPADAEAIKQLTQKLADDPDLAWGKLWTGLSGLGVPEGERQELFKKVRELYTHQQIDAKWIRVNGTNGQHDNHTVRVQPPAAGQTMPPMPPSATTPPEPQPRVRKSFVSWRPHLRRPVNLLGRTPKIPRVPKRAVAFRQLFTFLPAAAVRLARAGWSNRAVRIATAGILALTVLALIIALIVRATRPYVVAGATKVYDFFINPYTLLLVMILAAILVGSRFAVRGYKWAAERKFSTHKPHGAATVIFGLLLLGCILGITRWNDWYPLHYQRLTTAVNLSEQQLHDQQQQALTEAEALRRKAEEDRNFAAATKASAEAQQKTAISQSQETADRLAETAKLRAQEQSIRAQIQEIERQISQVRLDREKRATEADQQLADARNDLSAAQNELAAAQKRLAEEQQAAPSVATPAPVQRPAPPRQAVQRRTTTTPPSTPTQTRDSASVPWPPKR